MVWAEINKNIRFFLSENFEFSEVKFYIYLNRRVFVMNEQTHRAENNWSDKSKNATFHSIKINMEVARSGHYHGTQPSHDSETIVVLFVCFLCSDFRRLVLNVCGQPSWACLGLPCVLDSVEFSLLHHTVIIVSLWCFTAEIQDPYTDWKYFCNVELHQN